MSKKNGNPAKLLMKANITPIIRVFFEINQLKQLYRKGWLMSGIPTHRCESVAEHTFSVAVLAYFLADKYFQELDVDKIIKMSLIHDIGEVRVGDLVPGDSIKRKEKSSLELEAVEDMLGSIDDRGLYQNLWKEFDAGKTNEAEFVCQVDRLEMALQASVYDHQDLIDPQEFFQSCVDVITIPELSQLLHEIIHLK